MTDHDNAYSGLLGDADPHWAFGTGFTDPLAGVDPAVPSDVDRADLAAYCLMLGDDALVLS
jgi:ring-1,2-phenylacetyl-CoA epoxidase subunit PaaC